MSDYLEINFHEDDNHRHLLYVMGRQPQAIAIIGNFTSPAVRYQGVWTINHEWNGHPTTTMIPAADLTHFKIVDMSATNHQNEPGHP